MIKQLNLYFVVSLVLLSYCSASGQVKYGIKAGFNAGKVNYRVHSRLSPRMIPSFQVGGVAEFPLPMDFYLNTGLELQGKGYRYVIDSVDYKISAKVNPLYIQVPVKLLLRAPDLGIYGGVGTYLAYGIAGKASVTQAFPKVEDNITDSENVSYGTAEQDHFQPLDFGASLEFGYQSDGGLRVTAEYSWGLGDFRKEPKKVTNIIAPVNHRVVSISVAYFLNN